VRKKGRARGRAGIPPNELPSAYAELRIFVMREEFGPTGEAIVQADQPEG
jgi:hypothetical protein